jgi:hypothetical protein
MQILSVRMEMMCELHGFRQHVPPRGLAELREVFFIVVNQ